MPLPCGGGMELMTPSDRILTAAAMVFAESGYAGASLTVLARRCGISKA